MLTRRQALKTTAAALLPAVVLPRLHANTLPPSRPSIEVFAVTACACKTCLSRPIEGRSLGIRLKSSDWSEVVSDGLNLSPQVEAWDPDTHDTTPFRVRQCRCKRDWRLNAPSCMRGMRFQPLPPKGEAPNPPDFTPRGYRVTFPLVNGGQVAVTFSVPCE